MKSMSAHVPVPREPEAGVESLARLAPDVESYTAAPHRAGRAAARRRRESPNGHAEWVRQVRRELSPTVAAPAVGALLLTILISGALAAASSPVLLSPVVQRLVAALPGRLRRGVTPTEQ